MIPHISIFFLVRNVFSLCHVHLYNIYIIFCTNPFIIYIIFELNIPFDIFIKWAWCAYCVARREKNIRSRILCRIAPIDSKRATDCIRAIFRAFTARKPPGVHVTKRKMYRACAVMERYWRNKRTGADDWPITRWPRYLRWYWLGHWMSVQPQTSNASAPRTSSPPILPRPRPRLDCRPTLCPSLSLPLLDLVSFALTRFRLPATRDVLSRYPPRRNWIYGFIFLLCGQHLSADCTPKKRCSVITTK